MRPREEASYGVSRNTHPIPPLRGNLQRAKVFDTESRDNVLAFQVLAGIDRALSEEATAPATLRWSRFEASAGSNLPDLRCGSQIPAISYAMPAPTLNELDGIGGISLVAGIRYAC